MREWFRTVCGIRRLFLPLFFFFCLASAVLAAPPFVFQESDSSGTLTILFPKNENFEEDGVIDLHFHVFNSTGFVVDNTSTRCWIHVYDDFNNHVLKEELVYNNEFDFEAGNVDVSSAGLYPYNMWCNSTFGEGGFVGGFFVVTAEGEDETWVRYAVMFLVLIVLLGFGFASEDTTAIMLAGFLAMAIGVYLAINGLFGWNDLTIQAVSLILIAFGAYISLRAGIESFENKV